MTVAHEIHSDVLTVGELIDILKPLSPETYVFSGDGHLLANVEVGLQDHEGDPAVALYESIRGAQFSLTPVKPPTITVEVPLDVARRYAAWTPNGPRLRSDDYEAIRQATQAAVGEQAG